MTAVWSAIGLALRRITDLLCMCEPTLASTLEGTFGWFDAADAPCVAIRPAPRLSVAPGNLSWDAVGVVRPQSPSDGLRRTFTQEVNRSVP